jgi:cobalt-zinc-cadmium efflux system membrane fusion protein
MIRNAVFTALVLASGVAIGWWLLSSPEQHTAHDGPAHDETQAAAEAKGAHAGRMLREGDFALELTIFEQGVPPEFHIYAYMAGEPLDPHAISVVVKLSRLDGQVDTLQFQPQGDFLRGGGTVTEPHSFDVDVEASYQGKTHRWQYQNYEGRTTIPAAIVAESGIQTEAAGPHAITETLHLTGRVQVDPNRLSQVRARFPGVVQKGRTRIG